MDSERWDFLQSGLQLKFFILTNVVSLLAPCHWTRTQGPSSHAKVLSAAIQNSRFLKFWPKFTIITSFTFKVHKKIDLGVCFWVYTLPILSTQNIAFHHLPYFPQFLFFLPVISLSLNHSAHWMIFDKCTLVASFKSFNSELEGPVQADSYTQALALPLWGAFHELTPQLSTTMPHSAKFRRKFKAW